MHMNLIVTSILKVLQKQYMSPTGPNKSLRGITTTKTDQLELDLLKVKILKTAKRSLENLIKVLEKGNNSCKSRSNFTKLKLDLYKVKIYSNTKFQLNISKSCRNTGKHNFSKGQ